MRWFTVQELADLLGIQPATVRTWCTSGRLRCLLKYKGRRRGRYYSIPESAVVELLDAKLTPRAAQAQVATLAHLLEYQARLQAEAVAKVREERRLEVLARLGRLPPELDVEREAQQTRAQAKVQASRRYWESKGRPVKPRLPPLRRQRPSKAVRQSIAGLLAQFHQQFRAHQALQRVVRGEDPMPEAVGSPQAPRSWLLRQYAPSYRQQQPREQHWRDLGPAAALPGPHLGYVNWLRHREQGPPLQWLSGQQPADEEAPE